MKELWKDGYDEISIGDFLWRRTSGVVVIDAIVRLLRERWQRNVGGYESFSEGLLDHPHYTRPPELQG